MRVSATMLEGFRLYRDTDWKEEAELLAEIKGEFQPTPKMMLGRSGHCAMEGAQPKHEDSAGLHRCYGFRWARDTIAACRRSFQTGGVSEVKAERTLAVGKELVTLVGKADRLIGTEVVEHKFTLSQFDFDRYAESYQWRVYGVLFVPSAVLYTVYCVSEGRGDEAPIELDEVHNIRLPLYPALSNDVQELLAEFVRYVDLRGLRPWLQPRTYQEATA